MGQSLVLGNSSATSTPLKIKFELPVFFSIFQAELAIFKDAEDTLLKIVMSTEELSIYSTNSTDVSLKLVRN